MFSVSHYDFLSFIFVLFFECCKMFRMGKRGKRAHMEEDLPSDEAAAETGQEPLEKKVARRSWRDVDKSLILEGSGRRSCGGDVVKQEVTGTDKKKSVTPMQKEADKSNIKLETAAKKEKDGESATPARKKPGRKSKAELEAAARKAEEGETTDTPTSFDPVAKCDRNKLTAEESGKEEDSTSNASPVVKKETVQKNIPKKKRGRPLGSKNKPKQEDALSRDDEKDEDTTSNVVVKTEVAEKATAQQNETTQKKRGRPVGSKNKRNEKDGDDKERDAEESDSSVAPLKKAPRRSWRDVDKSLIIEGSGKRREKEEEKEEQQVDEQKDEESDRGEEVASGGDQEENTRTPVKKDEEVQPAFDGDAESSDDEEDEDEETESSSSEEESDSDGGYPAARRRRPDYLGSSGSGRSGGRVHAGVSRLSLERRQEIVRRRRTNHVDPMDVPNAMEQFKLGAPLAAPVDDAMEERVFMEPIDNPYVRREAVREEGPRMQHEMAFEERVIDIHAQNGVGVWALERAPAAVARAVAAPRQPRQSVLEEMRERGRQAERRARESRHALRRAASADEPSTSAAHRRALSPTPGEMLARELDEAVANLDEQIDNLRRETSRLFNVMGVLARLDSFGFGATPN